MEKVTGEFFLKKQRRVTFFSHHKLTLPGPGSNKFCSRPKFKKDMAHKDGHQGVEEN